ncbi:MAG: hypothetical protein Q8J63_00265 [Candidatus Aquicultor sp.]|nr:hypothetical protein [Candidatus Aquicultor sp.]
MKRLLLTVALSLGIVFVTYAASLALSDESGESASESFVDENDTAVVYSVASSSSNGSASYSSESHTVAIENNLSIRGEGAEGGSATNVTIVSGDGTVSYEVVNGNVDFDESGGGSGDSTGTDTNPTQSGDGQSSAESVSINSKTVVSNIVESHSPGVHVSGNSSSSVSVSSTTSTTTKAKIPAPVAPQAQPDVSQKTEANSGTAEQPREVEMAIAPATIHLGGAGKLRVILYGGAGFDATTIEATTVKLSGAGTAQVRETTCDMNGDGLADVVLYFDIADLSLTAGETELCLTGATTGGLAFKACTAVSVLR